jgi:translin
MYDRSQELEGVVEDIRVDFEAKHAAREVGLVACRQALRHSANAVRVVHRGDFPAAEDLLRQASELLEKARVALADHPDIYYAGFVHDAQKEYAEGCTTLALIAARPLPGPKELKVENGAYLNGLGEAVGELRRHLLDALRSGDVTHCEVCLSNMDDIYSMLVTFDYPEAITSGLRRTADAVRGILERTRGDLTLSVRQRDLERKLDEFESRL